MSSKKVLRIATGYVDYEPRQAAEPERKTMSEWNKYYANKLGAGSLVLETPDPYKPATDQAPSQSLPCETPGYDPYGQPPGRRQLLVPVNDNYFCRCWGLKECGAT